MIKETTYYEVICDACGERLNIDNITAWETYEEAQDALNYAGWEETETERVYCDECLDHGLINFGDGDNEEYDN